MPPGDTEVTGDVRHPKSRSSGDKPKEVTVEAAPQHANRVGWRVSHGSAELGIATGSKPSA